MRGPVSVLVATLLIIAIFIAALFRLNLGVLIASLLEFLHDLTMSLHALKMEIKGARGKKTCLGRNGRGKSPHAT